MSPAVDRQELPSAPAHIVQIETPVGPGRVTIYSAVPTPTGGAPRAASAAESGADIGAARTRGTLVLGHGAGGSGPTADLTALTGLTAHGWTVVLVDQPWRVAGRWVATPAAQLDTAWRAIWSHLPHVLPPEAQGGPLVGGGRSSGARVVARPAAELAPAAMLFISFPLTPPRKSGGTGPSRAPELQAALAAAAEHGSPILAVQGSRDPFGTPAQLLAALSSASDGGALDVRAPEAGAQAELPRGVRVESVPGDHSLSRSATRTAHLVGVWLDAWSGSSGERAEGRSTDPAQG